ncbi:uncharacterized protein LOC6541110 [Drosophila erecta]|uniref:Uncharacterized protein n=1 Tax=Drosophila erecta TaxID=7220 RepID=B3NAR8_DROER|nr:uncharacterized protein LOC6541110 [Drosophila erecta]EDV57591.1 uncharacterized protein Dere_GG24455 [Drosophila erecta]
MTATRVLLILQLLACLMTLISGSNLKSCHPFIGLNNCVASGYKEPKLPPRDNACCGPHCVYKGPSVSCTGPCNNKAVNRCLLDTHCGAGQAFSFVCMSDCELAKKNTNRLAAGYARLISFPMAKNKCLAMNTKCGINCCCRENCPNRFCKF